MTHDDDFLAAHEAAVNEAQARAYAAMAFARSWSQWRNAAAVTLLGRLTCRLVPTPTECIPVRRMSGGVLL